MDWITGAMTLLAMELIGRKYWQGWLVGLVNEFLWAYLIYSHQLWGLIPLTALLTWRYSVHLYGWRQLQDDAAMREMVEKGKAKARR